MISMLNFEKVYLSLVTATAKNICKHINVYDILMRYSYATCLYQIPGLPVLSHYQYQIFALV